MSNAVNMTKEEGREKKKVGVKSKGNFKYRRKQNFYYKKKKTVNNNNKEEAKENQQVKKPEEVKETKTKNPSSKNNNKKQVKRPNNNNKQQLAKVKQKQPKKSKEKLKIIPLGGLEVIGMNITVYEYENTIIVVDCGLAFPEDDMYGIDLVIPDITYLKENIHKVKAFFITHGHEDHIGALPYILKEINVPIYGTKLTMALIENKLKEHNLLDKTKRKIIQFGQSVTVGKMRVEFIKTNHSIVDAATFAIYSPVGTVIHTGDFKVDYTPVYGDAIDLQRLAEIGKKGVLALLSDSTNAERPGFTQSEKTVGKTFDHLFEELKDQRIIIATFASNVDRVQQIINTAHKYGRKVTIEGRSMVNTIRIASELGYLNIPANTLIETDRLNNYEDKKTVIITTGSQGESMAALSRMANGTHRKVTIKPQDAIIFSSHPIPGNEKAVSRIMNELAMKGASTVFQDVHVSGHACQEEIKLLYSLISPKYAIPVHGEYKHRRANAAIAESLDIPKENIFLMQNGDIMSLDEESAEITGNVPTGGVFVDGLGIGDVGNIVMRDRQKLAEDGILMVIISVDKYNGILLSNPEVVSRGFVYVRESEDLMVELKEVVGRVIDGYKNSQIPDRNKAKNDIRDAVSSFIWRKTKRSPMVMPIIIEIEM